MHSAKFVPPQLFFLQLSTNIMTQIGLVYVFLISWTILAATYDTETTSDDCQWVSNTFNEPLYAVGPCFTSKTDTLTQSYQYGCNMDGSMQISYFATKFCEGQVSKIETCTQQGYLNTYWNCKA
eukprot:312206_1